MSSSFADGARKSDEQVSQETQWGFHVVEALYAKSKYSRFTMETGMPGLLLIGYKIRSERMSRRLRATKTNFSPKDFGGLEKGIPLLLSKTRTDNSLGISMLVFDRKHKANLMVGMVPFFWWPLGEKLIRDIIFRRFVVVTIFNPAHFLSQLDELGYSSHLKDGKYEIRKQLAQGTFVIEDATYYFMLISQYLFSEQSVVNMITKAKDLAEKGGQGKDFRMDLNIYQVFGPRKESI